MTDREQDLNLKAAADPGWNDPPVFNYDTQETFSRQSKGLSLNKRVVFPFSPSSSVNPPTKEDNTSSIILPPTDNQSSIAPLPPPKGLSKVDSTVENCRPTLSTTSDAEPANSAENVPSLDIILKNFNDTIEGILEEKETSEIKRRLAVMEKMWKEDKYNLAVQEKILKLSLALKDNRIEEGDNLQRNLMVDHTNLCSNWMPAIRKLIYLKKNSSTL